jgi:hypothetical protein
MVSIALVSLLEPHDGKVTSNPNHGSASCLFHGGSGGFCDLQFHSGK